MMQTESELLGELDALGSADDNVFSNILTRILAKERITALHAELSASIRGKARERGLLEDELVLQALKRIDEHAQARFPSAAGVAGGASPLFPATPKKDDA